VEPLLPLQAKNPVATIPSNRACAHVVRIGPPGARVYGEKARQ